MIKILLLCFITLLRFGLVATVKALCWHHIRTSVLTKYNVSMMWVQHSKYAYCLYFLNLPGSEKRRDLTKSYDKSPYTDIKTLKAT